MEVNKELARELVKIKAVQINPNKFFTWTSGIKSPIYCDNRMTMSYPKVRKKIVNAFKQFIENMEEQPEVIAGCATAGIPHAAWLAEALDLPMVYVRGKAKGHGKGNQIEGDLREGQRVIVIEDLISTGGSSIEAAKSLEKSGAEVLGVLAIFTYGLAIASENFKKEKIYLYTITNFDSLVDLLVEDGELPPEKKAGLLEWRNQL
ncbi:orotate phosphoribosyltransferase [Virgibacillus halodenitrificans]|uniref:Orotate phosphoribosyltransferase n=1 Tax=Virgibacillus halodenitrificans TaxID=1482 RepID=A0ABR7VRJ7_VIRHA|nr:orotate phosphoribosyltransferase [Virgibacillus halodenitrificans]MBD1224490.1 orotate phosphoribosyltransferase [Virgibacillus halodenitrificans]